ncbi:uncharacterized protein [Diabrotica undecimpunctata]|uniref:uncharacterized protein n=1 Tax=Diabrotica undecimpunctata TaxID=50387 RepID=UPI003B639F24
MTLGLPFYLFLGLVHHFYLLDNLVVLNRHNCDIKRINESKTNLDICLRPEYDYTQINFLVHGPKDDPYTFVQQRCSLKSVLDNCLHKTVDYLSVCFNDTMNQGLEVWKKIDNNMVEYVCRDNAEVALELFNKTSSKCWETTVTQAIHECTRSLDFSVPLYDAQGLSRSCSKSEEMISCFKSHLARHCPDKVVAIGTTIVHIIKNEFCNN